MINQGHLLEILGLEVDIFEANTLALSNSIFPNSLSFVDDEKYLEEINNNENIVYLFVTDKLSKQLNNSKKQFIVEDPRFSFYTLLNHLGKSTYKKTPSVIHPKAVIHPKSFISEYNVRIGANTTVHANVTILADVEIGEDCIFQPGAVIGSEGFEYKRTSKGILPVYHDGKVVIKNKVEIGANTCVDKGFSFRPTIIENEVKIDNLIHVAHGVHIKEGAFIIAGTVLGGSVTVEENAWLSVNSSIAPGITIKSNGFVSIGAVVTKDVPSGTQVTGNFAIEHKQFLKSFKRFIKE